MMEDLICSDPEKHLNESGLKLISRQYRLGSYIFDILLEDRHGAKLIVELQKGTLDRVHTYKIIDYYDEFKTKHPGKFVELMIVANVVPRERRERLSSYGITWKEIPIKYFIDELNDNEKQIESIKEETGTDILPSGLPNKIQTYPLNSRQYFWSLFLKGAKETTSLFDNTNPTQKHYIGPTINKLQYLAVSKDHESWVEICIQQADESKDIYQGIIENKAQVEEKFGEKLRWVNDPTKKRCKVMSYSIPFGFKDLHRIHR